jgi:cytochrome bd-type quinol oxidase subunit 2
MSSHHRHHHHSSHHASAAPYYEEDREDTPTTSSSSSSRCFFGFLYTVSQLFLFGSVILFVYWIVQHEEGFAWANHRGKQFNLHAVLMMTGFIFLNGQAMLIYKSFQCCKKIYNKIIHCIIFVCSISAITIGVVAAIQGQHNVPKGAAPKHFYSVHSWIGLTAISLFALQFIVGFVSFLVLLCCDRATSKFRAALLPTHVTFGLIIFHLASAACLTGILQTARYRLSGKDGRPAYKDLEEPTIVINAVGACIIGLSIIIPYIVRNCGQQQKLKM